MAETTRLSVGQALDKLRGAEAPISKLAQLDDKIDALNKETRRLRATRLSLERIQRTDSLEVDAQGASKVPITNLKRPGIIIGLVIVILCACWLFWP